MFFFSLFVKERDPKLEENEAIIHRTKRHWMVLLQRVLIPALLLLLTVMVVLFRLSGGRVAVLDEEGAGFDIWSGLIIVVLLGLVVAYQRSLRVNSKNRTGRRNLFIAGVVLFGYLVFHFLGGRLIGFGGASSGMDGTNVFLVVTAIVLLLVIDWITFDWRSDDLILTNMRVIQEDFIPLIRDFRNQILVEDVQSVVGKTESYLQNFLGYGTVIVQSAAQSRIVFTGAGDFESIIDPVTGFSKRVSVVQRKLQEELDRRNKDKGPRELRNLVEKQVYGNAPPPTVPPVSVPAGDKGNWIFPQNPEIRSDKDRTIIWRKFWLFELLQLLYPVLSGIVLVAGLILIYGNTLVPTATLVVAGLFALILLGFWGWYLVVDYRNDLYILTLSSIIDIEKKPFGPENRRSAGLGQIQNVNYQTSFWGNLLGYGDVFVQTAGQGTTFTFSRVPRPREVSTTINDYLNSFRQGDKERNLREALSLLKEYHTAQKDHGELR